MKHGPWAMLLFVVLSTACTAAIVGTLYGQDLARKTDAGMIAVADRFLAGVSAPAVQERCSVRNQASPTTCDCGPNKAKVQAACITCSTPSGKTCSTKCQQCGVVCDPGGSVPSQSLDCN